MARWDALTATQRVVGLAAVDAHAWIGLPGLAEAAGRTAGVSWPGYEALFDTASIAAVGVRLTGDANEDAAAVLDALRHGHVYSTVDAIAGGGGISFTATSGRHAAVAGDVLPLDGEVMLQVDVQGPADARVILLRDGVPITTVEQAQVTESVAAEAAVYRVEVEWPGAPRQRRVPWLVSNPIYVGFMEPPASQMRSADAATPLDQDLARWTVEHSPQSDGAIDLTDTPGGGRQAILRFALSGPVRSPRWRYRSTTGSPKSIG